MSILKNIDKLFAIAGIIFIIIFIRLEPIISVLLGYGLVCLGMVLIFFAYMIRSQSTVLIGMKGLREKDQNRDKKISYLFTSRFFNPGVFSTLLFIFLLCVLSIILFLPSPLVFIQDQDWSHQLAGANQILKGEHPFITFLDVYGPLTFYSSALAQFIFGTRVIGEIFLIVVGFSIAYTMMFWLMWSISRDKLLAFILLIILLILIPRLYKYYIILGSALTLTFVWKYVEQPSYKKIWLVGFGVVITGLFRPDFGIYMTISVVVALLSRQNFTIRQKFFDLLYFAAVLFIIVLPWLIFVYWRGGLQDYLYNSTIGMIMVGGGMSLPDKGSQDVISLKNLQLGAKIAFNLIPVLTLVVFLKKRQQIDSITKSMLPTLIVASQFTLIQGLHRSDYQHLLQAIPITFILLAYLFKQLSSLFVVPPRMMFILGLGLGVGLLSTMLFFSLPKWRALSPGKTLDYLSVYSMHRDQFTEHLIQNNPKNTLLQAMNFIGVCTKPGDKIVAWPYLIDFYYFTDRPLGGRLKGVGPIFNTPEEEELVVRNMEADDISYFIFRPHNFSSTAREISDYAPVIANYLKETYSPIKQFGNITILINRDRLPMYGCADQ